jgi:hypothetical protein
MEVATSLFLSGSILSTVSTPFLPNGSRYCVHEALGEKIVAAEFQHLFFLMEVATLKFKMEHGLNFVCFNTFSS